MNQSLPRLRRSGIRQYTNLAKTVTGCVMLTLSEPDFATLAEIKPPAPTSVLQTRTHYAPYPGS